MYYVGINKFSFLDVELLFKAQKRFLFRLKNKYTRRDKFKIFLLTR